MRTLGSLCERPRDTRQPLRSSDAAMGPAGAGRAEGAARTHSIRDGQGHWRGGWRGRLFKKENQKGQGNARSRRTAPGPLRGGETIARRRRRGASRRARPRAAIYSYLFPFFSLYSRGKKKKVELGNKNFFLSVFIACLGQG